MKLLLDTHTLIWWDSQPDRLSANALDSIEDMRNDVHVSAVSIWEIVIKAQLGKLSLNLALSDVIAKQRLNGLQFDSIELQHVLGIATLPPIHKDPFDRLLIAIANNDDAVLVTCDPIFESYAVTTLW